MPNVMVCPSEHDLQQLLLGRIPDAEAESLEEHLSQCERCLQAASTLKVEDTLAEAVRAQAAVPDLSTGELVTELMERLEKLRPAVSVTPQTEALTIAADDTSPAKKTQTPPTPSAEATQVIYQFLAPPEAPEELGRLGQYRIRKVLGTGGMGVVFEALDPHLGRLVALKAMLPALASNPSAHERFMREAKAVAAIEHDHIIAIHQVGEESGVPYLAMPLLKGETLEDRLKREPRLPLPLLLQIGRETGEGLAAAHSRGLIHRDIKPANLWLELKEGEIMTDTLTPVVDKPIKRVKILDFGLARAAGDTQITQLGAIVGTPAYMAPEQTRAGGVVDHRADLFSLGCVLYRAATGELPFRGGDTMSILSALALDTPPSPRELNPQIPARLSDLIMQLLAKKPDDRPASAQEVVAWVGDIEKGAMPTALRGHGVEKQGLACPRKAVGMAPPGRWIAIAVALLFGALSVAAYQLGPTVYRFVTNRGEVVVTTDDPDVQVIVKQGGQVIKIVDKATKQELILDAGDYELELPRGTPKPMKVVPQKFTLERGGRQIVTVTFWNTPTENRPQQARAASGAPVDIWTIHALGRPTGKTLTQDGVTKDGDGWRIVAEEPRTVRLFEIPNPSIEDCTVIFRASMKSENVKGRAYLEMWARFPGQGEYFSKDLPHLLQGTTDWSSFETPFYLKKGERPDLIKLNLAIEGKGTVWIKDLKLLRAPLPVMGEGGAIAPEEPKGKPGVTAPQGQPSTEGSTLLWRPKGDPLTRDGVTKDGDGWRIESDEARTVRLFQIRGANVEDCMVIFRTAMKSERLKGKAYLEMLCHFPGQGDFFSRDLDHPIQGTTDWSSFETPFYLKKGERPDLIKLNLVIEGRGTVWIKDLKLLKAPLPVMGEGSAIAPEERKNRPGPVTRIEEGVRFNGEVWRIEAVGPRSVQLREVTKPETFDGPALLVYSAEMKTKDVKGRAYLEMLCDFPGQGEFFSKGLDNAVKGTTDWTKYNTVFRLEKGQRPERVKLRVVIEGKGTVWVKNPDLKVMNLLKGHKEDFPGVQQPARERTGRRTPKGKGIPIAEFLAKAVPVEGESYGIIPAQLGVTTLGDAWRIDADGKRTAEIYEINKPKFPGDGPVFLEYRAEMKLENFTGRTYLEIAGQDFPSQEITVDPANNKSTTDWVPCLTSFQLKKNQRPGWIKLRVVVDGKGTVWVKNPKLLAMPIPEMQDLPREPGDQRLRRTQAGFTKGEIRSFAGHLGPVLAVRFSPDGKVVFAGGADGVRAWDAATGRRLWHVPDLEVFAMDISRDGQQLLAGVLVQNKSGSVCLLNAATGKILRTTKVSDNWACYLAFVADGSRYVALQSSHAFLSRETKTNKDIAHYLSPNMTITCIAVSPDGKWAVTGGFGMGLWNLNRPEEKSGFEQEHKGPIPDVAFSPDGKYVLSGGTDGTVRLWEVSRGRQIRELKGPNGKDSCVTSVAFSPDGRYAVAGREDGTIQLWHVSTGIHLGQYRPSQRDVRSVTFAPDGLSGLAGGADGSVWQWQLPPGSLAISD